MKKNKKLLLKQDKLLFVAFYILINLAEDILVEKKMLKKNFQSNVKLIIKGYKVFHKYLINFKNEFIYAKNIMVKKL
jgi:ABC-type iron transport system FetAB permease component